MKEYAESFYKSQKWQDCRDSYMKSVGCMCERCASKGIMTPAEIVHHIKHINVKTIKDPNITLNYDNLMAVCRKCHAELHGQKMRRFTILEDGTVIPKENCFYS